MFGAVNNSNICIQNFLVVINSWSALYFDGLRPYVSVDNCIETPVWM